MEEFVQWLKARSIPSEYRFAVMDASGDVHAYRRRPHAGAVHWAQGGGSVYIGRIMPDASIDWRRMIVLLPV